MNNCIFCKIINKEIEANVLYENEEVIMFLDAYPKSEGHTLIVPKVHKEDILKEGDFDILGYIKKANDILRDSYDFDDFKILINKGKKAGQEVFHTHVHFIPYYE